jgi:hypothetical protein
LRCSVLRGRSFSAAAKRAGEIGVVALDIVEEGLNGGVLVWPSTLRSGRCLI